MKKSVSISIALAVLMSSMVAADYCSDRISTEYGMMEHKEGSRYGTICREEFTEVLKDYYVLRDGKWQPDGGDGDIMPVCVNSTHLSIQRCDGSSIMHECSVLCADLPNGYSDRCELGNGLPDYFDVQKSCEENHDEVPEFGYIGGIIAIAGIAAMIVIKRK